MVPAMSVDRSAAQQLILGAPVIPADAHLEVAWLDPADLSPHPPQRLDWDKVGYYVGLMAELPDDEAHLAPVVVNACDPLGRYSIRDGRHRWVAHLALGRERIRCVVVKEP